MEKFSKMPNFRHFCDYWNSQDSPGSFIFQNFKNSHSKNLDIWVRILFVQKKISQGITEFTEANFKIWSCDNIFRPY